MSAVGLAYQSLHTTFSILNTKKTILRQIDQRLMYVGLRL